MSDQPGFFDMHSRLRRSRGRSAPAGAEPLSPSALNRLIEGTLKAHLPATVIVKGEVSNFSRNRNSGHLYFTLKDAQGAVEAVMWASRAERLKFEPRDGMELLATGGVSVYVPRGRYQLVADSLDPVGEGALEVAKRQLEERLRRLGLFDASRKRPIPAFPRTIAMVTSPQAAGYADMCKVLGRCPWLRLRLYPVPVQGAAAGPAIAAALADLSRRRVGIDVILLGRGGGSLEDLWAFNEEAVARAMAACPVPIVTGIGHEIDVSIADLVADHHAHTPTEAATFVVRHWIRADETLDAIALRLRREARQRIADARSRLAGIQRHEVFRRPAAMFDAWRQRLDDMEASLVRALRDRLTVGRHRLDRATAVLAQHPPTRAVRLARERVDAIEGMVRRSARIRLARVGRELESVDARLRLLNPLNVLKRGYSITTRKQDGRIVRSVADVRAGDRLVTRLPDGSVESIANDPKQPELF